MASPDGSLTMDTVQDPPYAPMVWLPGGPPVKYVDIPAQVVFMVLFMIGAAIHMKIFRCNLATERKFSPTLFIFFFCMERVVTFILRLVSISRPDNIGVSLAAQIFVTAGVLILFVINIVFAMRLVRATHRSFGWHPAFGIAFKLLFVLIGATLITVITATIRTSYTTNNNIRLTDRSLQLYGSTVLAIVATLPLLMTLLTLTIPYSPWDQFGSGRLRTRVIGLLVSTIFLSIGAWYRCGIAWQAPVPRTQPLPSSLGKAPFYILNFLFEVQTVVMYAVLRVDQRWYIPPSAHGPGSYSNTLSRHAVEIQNLRHDVEIQNSRHDVEIQNSRHDVEIQNSRRDVEIQNSRHDIQIQTSRPTPAASLTVLNSSVSISETKCSVSEIRIQIRPPPPSTPEPARISSSSRPSSSISHPSSSRLSLPISSRPASRRTSLLNQVLRPSTMQKRQSHASEESKRNQMPDSPTESAFSFDPSQHDVEASECSFVRERVTLGTGLRIVNVQRPPNIRATLHEDASWTPEPDESLDSLKMLQQRQQRRQQQ
ncbi:hypothetical protein ACEQ8H_006457 [Pleosporales sp. CAS-2024a]